MILEYTEAMTFDNLSEKVVNGFRLDEEEKRYLDESVYTKILLCLNSKPKKSRHMKKDIDENICGPHLSTLERNGYIEKLDKKWKLNYKGKEFIEKYL